MSESDAIWSDGLARENQRYQDVREQVSDRNSTRMFFYYDSLPDLLFSSFDLRPTIGIRYPMVFSRLVLLFAPFSTFTFFLHHPSSAVIFHRREVQS